MADKDSKEVVVPTYSGRKEIFVDETDINESNIVSVLEEAFKIHTANRAQIKYLEKYERGITPILQRVKEIRPEINFKIAENHAHEITTFKVGYVFSSPISYVQRAKRDMTSPDGEGANADDRGIALLNEMMSEEGKAAKDQKLAKNFSVCGLGYKIALPKKVKVGKSVVDVLILDPKTTFVGKSNDIYKRPVLGVSYAELNDGSIRLGAYTETQYFELKSGTSGTSFKLIKTEDNPIGMVPIVEYKNDYECMGCFERVLPLLDALNNATSDRLNGLAQFVQSFLWMNNVDIEADEIAKLTDKLALLTKTSDPSLPVSVQYLTASLDQQQTQAFVDYLYEQILQISATPSRAQASGGNTGQAIVLGGGGWALAETAAKNTEQMFTESELEFLKVVLKIIQDSEKVPEEMANIQLSDIDIKFSRNRTDGLVSKTQALLNLLSAGVDPLKAFDVCGIFSDPQTVYNDSKQNLKKWETVAQNVSNNNPTPGEGE